MLFLDFIKLNTEHDELANFNLNDIVIKFIFSELKIYIPLNKEAAFSQSLGTHLGP